MPVAQRLARQSADQEGRGSSLVVIPWHGLMSVERSVCDERKVRL